jgi:serine/threonine protein kinase
LGNDAFSQTIRRPRHEDIVNDPDVPAKETPGQTPSSPEKVRPEDAIGTSTLLSGGDGDAGTHIEVSKGVVIVGAQLAVGDKVGKYEIRSLLGEGGMGAVYLAYDPLIEREVALKVLSQDVGSNPSALQRFLGEARAIGRLSNPHVVSIYDIDQWNGQYYLVMELITGGSVADLSDEKGALPWEQAFQIVAQAARGLEAAHAAGMIHRDIKPENLMLTADGLVKVVDFGLSKLLDDADDTRTAVTKAGQILGTPQYMSPEQFEAEEVDARTDVYSLGATLFRLLTARFPYHDCRTILQVMTAHVSKPPPIPTEHIATLPEECNRIVFRAMAKSRADRYQTAAELADALQESLDRKCPTSLAAAGPVIEDRPLSTVVIVEPSKLQGAVLKDAIVRLGARSVQTVSTIAAATPAVEREVPDLLITAMQLPDGRGIDLLGQLCRRSLLERACVVLNSGDSTLEELAAVGLAACLILAPKKVRPEEILRVVHAAGPCVAGSGPFAAELDPLTSRLRIVLDAERIPDALADMIRRLNLLDVEVTTQFERAARNEGETAPLTLVLRTAWPAANDGVHYGPLVSQPGNSSAMFAAVQVDQATLRLRAVGRNEVIALGNRPLDDARLVCLLQACRS